MPGLSQYNESGYYDPSTGYEPSQQYKGSDPTQIYPASSFEQEPGDGLSRSSYKLGSGDLITIQVYGEEDLSIAEIRLTDTGSFSYPFLGEIQVRGLTSAQVEMLISRGLRGDYLIDPKVTVSILEYRPFFVNGEVKKPGGYPFKPGLTLRKAIAIAGGFTDRASRSKFFIIRDDDPNREPVRIDLESPINPGDIVTVNESFF